MGKRTSERYANSRLNEAQSNAQICYVESLTSSRDRGNFVVSSLVLNKYWAYFLPLKCDVYTKAKIINNHLARLWFISIDIRPYLVMYTDEHMAFRTQIHCRYYYFVTLVHAHSHIGNDKRPGSLADEYLYKIITLKRKWHDVILIHRIKNK